MPADMSGICSSAFWLALMTLMLLAQGVQGLLLPGLAPTAHRVQSLIRVEVNDVRSSKNLVQYDFYNKKLPFATMKLKSSTATKLRKYSSNAGLAALLSGERHQWSPYVLPTLEDGCFYLSKTTMDKSVVKRTTQLIKRFYRVQMLVDGLPAINNGTRMLLNECAHKNFYRSLPKIANYQRGYYLGVPPGCEGQSLLNNHVHFIITYYRLSEEEADGYKDAYLGDGSAVKRGPRRPIKRAKNQPAASQDSEYVLVVGVNVVPYSIDWQRKKENGELDPSNLCREVENAFTMTQVTSTASSLRAAALAQATDEEERAFDNDEPVDDVNGDRGEEEYDGEEERRLQGEDELRQGNPNFPMDADDMPDDPYDFPDGYAEVDDGENDESIPALYKKEWRLSLPPKPNKDTAIVVHWTYSVVWKQDQSMKWASRWDVYVKASPFGVKKPTYLLSILLSSAVIAALLSLLATVLVRALRRDLLKSVPVYFSPEDELVAREEENGWKAIRGDVFRPPPRANLLAISTGAGIQTLLTLLAAVVCGIVGLASPANRGGLVALLLFFFLTSAAAGGALCAVLCVALGQQKQWTAAAGFVIGFSGSVLAIFTAVNLVLRMAGSSGAIPGSAMFSLYVLWLCIYCPLGFIGAAAGFRVGRKPTEKVTTVQRVIEYEKVWSLFRTPRLLWYSGVPPFFVGLLLLVNIFNGLWGGVMLYLFGFVCVTGSLWLVSCALTSVSVVYYNLCGENHRWHWLSFVAPSSAGLPVLAFTLYYYLATLRTTTLSGILVYTLYSTLLIYVYVLVSGAVGFLASFAFVKYIYSSVKSD